MAQALPRRKVLLARPHSFVVDAMEHFMSKTGYQPVRVKAFEDLAQVKPDEFTGVVISTALSADVSRPFAQVYAEVKRRLPSCAIAISGLGNFDTTVSLAKADLGQVANGLVFVGAGDTAQAAQLGRTSVLLVLRRDDVARPELEPTTRSAVQRHFG